MQFDAEQAMQANAARTEFEAQQEAQRKAEETERADAMARRAENLNALNDAAELRVYGSRGRTYHDPETGAVIADDKNELPGKIDQISENRRFGTTEDERKKVAEEYKSNIDAALDEGLELTQAEMLADRVLESKEKIGTLAGRFMGQGMSPEEAHSKAEDIYFKKNAKLAETIVSEGIMSDGQFKDYLENRNKAPEAPLSEPEAEEDREPEPIAPDEQDFLNSFMNDEPDQPAPIPTTPSAPTDGPRVPGPVRGGDSHDGYTRRADSGETDEPRPGRLKRIGQKLGRIAGGVMPWYDGHRDHVGRTTHSTRAAARAIRERNAARRNSDDFDSGENHATRADADDRNEQNGAPSITSAMNRQNGSPETNPDDIPTQPVPRVLIPESGVIGGRPLRPGDPLYREPASNFHRGAHVPNRPLIDVDGRREEAPSFLPDMRDFDNEPVRVPVGGSEEGGPLTTLPAPTAPRSETRTTGELDVPDFLLSPEELERRNAQRGQSPDNTNGQ